MEQNASCVGVQGPAAVMPQKAPYICTGLRCRLSPRQRSVRRAEHHQLKHPNANRGKSKHGAVGSAWAGTVVGLEKTRWEFSHRMHYSWRGEGETGEATRVKPRTLLRCTCGWYRITFLSTTVFPRTSEGMHCRCWPFSQGPSIISEGRSVREFLWASGSTAGIATQSEDRAPRCISAVILCETGFLLFVL